MMSVLSMTLHFGKSKVFEMESPTFPLLVPRFAWALLMSISTVVAEGSNSEEATEPVAGAKSVQNDSPDQSTEGATPRAKSRMKRKISKKETPRESQWLDSVRDEPGATRYQTFFSQTLQRTASYQIYFPPDYALDTTARYPVVYWLHGLGGDQRTGTRFVAILDKAIQAGIAPSMIVILVNGLRDRFYCDSLDGVVPVESVIVSDLIPEVDKVHRTIARREARIIEGTSMGGFGAIYLGFKYPEKFGVVSSVMAGIHDEDSIAEMYPTIFQSVYGGSKEYFQNNSPWTLVERNAEVIRGSTVVRIWIGGSDLAWRQDRNSKFHALLSSLRIDHEYRVIPEVGHEFMPLYEKMGDENWDFYRRALSPGRVVH